MIVDPSYKLIVSMRSDGEQCGVHGGSVRAVEKYTAMLLYVKSFSLVLIPEK